MSEESAFLAAIRAAPAMMRRVWCMRTGSRNGAGTTKLSSSAWNMPTVERKRGWKSWQ